MRSALINGSSPREDIVGVLTGVWNEYDTGLNKAFHVVKTPFFVVITATLQAGSHILPIAPENTAMLHWASKDSSGSIILKAHSPQFTLPEAALIEVTYWGSQGQV